MSKLITHIDEKWYAVRTKFRSEKYVVEGLNLQGVTGYIPLLKKVKQYSKKKKEHFIPLIHCYVFVKVSSKNYKKIYSINGVFDFVRIGGRMIPIPDDEIILMQRIVGERFDLRADVLTPVEGAPVEILAGSLTGLRGTLVKQANNNEFVVKLDHVGMNLYMNVPIEMMRVLHSMAV